MESESVLLWSKNHHALKWFVNSDWFGCLFCIFVILIISCYRVLWYCLANNTWIKKFSRHKSGKKQEYPLQIGLKPCEQYEKWTTQEVNNIRVPPVYSFIFFDTHILTCLRYTKNVLVLAKMFDIMPSGDTLETFATFNLMCKQKNIMRTYQRLVVNEPLSLVVKNVSGNSPFAN